MSARIATATRKTVAINEIVRTAISRTTGTTTNVERAGSDEDHWAGIDEEWAVVCVDHNQVAGIDSRREAWLVSTHPEFFCSECASIVRNNNK
jgi:hypothetical protein